MHMIDIAKKYIAAGFSVIPVGTDKKPIVQWREYQTRYATDAELEEWFSEPRNIGIVTGKISGITVVDIDAKNGGLESMKSLRLPLTWSVKTGGGGWHLYFNYDERVHQTQALYQGVDIRNDGGYVIAPPSMHISGNRYEWSFKDGDKADIPADLFVQRDIVKKDWAGLLKLGTTEGNRNGTAASLFGKLMTMFKVEEWETVWDIGKFWNMKNNPPLEEQELRSVFESIAKKAVQNMPKDVEEIVKGADKASEIATRIKVNEKEKKRFFTWGDTLLDKDMPIVENHTYTVLYGQAGSGKTTFARTMARQNKNACFLTLEMTREKLVRQYCFNRAGVGKEAYKEGKYDQTIFDTYASELDGIKILGVDEGQTKKDYTCDDIEKIAQQDDIDIIFIDNFNKLVSSEENGVQADNDTSSKLLFITRTYDIAIVVIHHTNKPQKQRHSTLRGLTGMRGSNKLVDDADIVCELGRDFETNLTHVAVYKDRDWDQRSTQYLEYVDGEYKTRLMSYMPTPIQHIAF